jgi:hypothetical protein
MNTKPILIAALLAAALAPAMAQQAAQAFEHANFNGPLMLMHGKPVKNAPYSAEAVSEQTQSLSDGNQIVNKTSTMSYRDSAGRTRQETRNASGAPQRITIHDALEGSTYILNPETRTATKVGPRREMARIDGERARHLEEMSKARADAREQIIVKRVERADAELNQRVRENVRIQVTRQMTEGHPMPGMIAGAFGDMKWSSKASTKDLGTREIDGVKAQGKLRSYEIPAGEIGNRNAIVVSTETWYSPELQVTLLSKRSDPRSGERSYRLAGLKREEPAAALFTVPSDYTVKDAMAIRKTKEEKQ